LIGDQQLSGEPLTATRVFDRIRGSNSSLNRRPKKVLEDSIERVLEVVKADAAGDDDSESIEGDFEGLEVQDEAPPVSCARE
jgi:ribosome biogenesis ATPase